MVPDWNLYAHSPLLAPAEIVTALQAVHAEARRFASAGEAAPWLWWEIRDLARDGQRAARRSLPEDGDLVAGMVGFRAAMMALELWVEDRIRAAWVGAPDPDFGLDQVGVAIGMAAKHLPQLRELNQVGHA